jgi:phosphatidylglycerol:prolipoprotein diacylglycerol transferase
MHPYLVKIPLPGGGTLKVASYGFLIMVGFLLALYLAQRRARRVGVSPNDLFDSAVAMLIAGIVGARLFFVIEFWDHLKFGENPIEILRIDKGGLVFYGGLIGGGVALLIMVLRRKMPFRATLGVVSSVIPLGHAFGRLGCFFNGCCYGWITRSFLGVRFPRIMEEGNIQATHLNVGHMHITGSPPFIDHLTRTPPLVDKTALWSLPVHPTQLYAVGYNLLIFAFLTWMLPRRWRAGEMAWLYGIFYGSFRFANEMLRVTEPLFWGLTVAQWICLPLVLFALTMFAWQRSKPHEPLPEPIAADEGGQ